MIAHCLILICFNLLHLSFVGSSDVPGVTAPSLKFIKLSNPKIKREVVNLEVFDDIKKVKEEDKTDVDGVIFVCENEREVECSCYIDEQRMECGGDKLRTLNLKPVIDNFIIQKVGLSRSKNLTFEKGKIFPGNEETIKNIHFRNNEKLNFENNVFDTFTNLKTLWFWNTPVSNIDENLLTEKLGKVLINLEFYECNLTEINPTIFKNLLNLEKLRLPRNKQLNGKINGKFPEGLQKLKFLDLSMCNLSSLNPDTFENLRNLEDLFLSSNRFTSIPSTIKTLPKLKIFIFSSNLIKKIEKNEFISNFKLENIVLNMNLELKYIENCAFCNVEKLEEIHLSFCDELAYIDENAFGAIRNGFSTKLGKFNIRGCNISVLHENLLDWKNTKEFDFAGNPFACNCSMAWLFKDLMSKNSIYENKLSHDYFDVHHKFALGCLGPPPRTPNHTYPYTVVEIFSSCENTPSFSYLFWCFLAFLSFIVLFGGLIYANRSRF